VVLDTTVLNVALPTLVRDLIATSTYLQWIVDAYVVVFAGLIDLASEQSGAGGKTRTRGIQLERHMHGFEFRSA
jgi:MFS family permease